MNNKNIVKRILMAGLPVPGFLRPLIRSLYKLGVIANETLVFAWAFIFIKPIVRSIAECGRGLRVERLPYMRGKGKLVLGDNANLSGKSCFYFMSVAGPAPVIQIGADSFIGNACTLSSAKSISIGSNCLISSEVRIQDNDGHPIDPAMRLSGQKMTSDDIKPVFIGNNVWIGSGAVILKGIRIGDNAVIGAASVVTKDIPSDVMAAGVPAVVIKKIV